ncbi:MAG: histidine kinase dimerization/phospho-acceptor domain-containing protein [Pleurocapsa sp. MO_192.B19]|nr:histidine kinase dimerization/phospho-acceptor domain-containing protein [Pleurocapsa sp. MO_192.B19]
MFLATIFTKFLKPSFPISLGRSILVYFTTAVAIIGISEISLYFWVVNNLEQQSNHELLSLVELASPSLETVKTEGLENLSEEAHWRNVFAKQERSLEWFDAEGKFLAREGTKFLESPLKQSVAATNTQESLPVFNRQAQARSVSIAVYRENLDSQAVVLEGYIRASESTEKMDLVRHQLQLRLVIGITVALILMSMTSTYLTQQTIMPVNDSLKKRKEMATEVSHQLRTPLSRISMATEILLTHKTKISASDNRKIEIIEDAVEQLKGSIEDLLFSIRWDQK